MTLVLNLERRPARLEALAQQAGMQTLRWERVDAVDGVTAEWDVLASQLTREALEDAQWAEANSVPTLCTATGDFSPHHTRASAACAATHRKAWERLAKSTYDVALILEDDARVVPQLADKVRIVINVLQRTRPFWTMCYLGTHDAGRRANE